ncbi:hypothetical protein D3C80_892580 [compost metagenome]
MPEQAVEASFYALMDGGAGVEFGGGQARHDLHCQQLVAHVRVIPGQVPAPDLRLTASTQFQGCGGLVLHFDGLDLLAIDPRRAPDQRPGVGRFNGAAKVAVQLQAWVQVIA